MSELSPVGAQEPVTDDLLRAVLAELAPSMLLRLGSGRAASTARLAAIEQTGRGRS
jgi:hypothetical protein